MAKNSTIKVKEWKHFYLNLLKEGILNENLLKKKLFAYVDNERFWIQHPDAKTYMNAKKALEDILYEKQIEAESKYKNIEPEEYELLA